jgi:hypothetical protein
MGGNESASFDVGESTKDNLRRKKLKKGKVE